MMQSIIENQVFPPKVDVGSGNWISPYSNNSIAIGFSETSIVDFEVARKRMKLVRLQDVVSKCVGKASIFFPNFVDSETAAYGKALLALLDDADPLPTVSVDGEGGLLLVWEGRRTVLTTVVRSCLYITVDPGLLTASNFEGIEFKSRYIPPELKDSLVAV